MAVAPIEILRRKVELPKQEEKRKGLCVMVFGDSFFMDAQSVKCAIDIIDIYRRDKIPLIVIVSELEGARDMLNGIIDARERLDKDSVQEGLREFCDMHVHILDEMPLTSKGKVKILKRIYEVFDSLYQFFAFKELTSAKKDDILSCGSKLNARILEGRCLDREIKAETVDTLEEAESSLKEGKVPIMSGKITFIKEDLGSANLIVWEDKEEISKVIQERRK